MRKILLVALLGLLSVFVLAGDILVVGGKIVTAPGSQVANAPSVEVFGFNEYNNYGGTIEQTRDGSGMNGYKFDGVWPLVPPSGRPLVWPTNTVTEWYRTADNNSYRDEYSGEGLELLTGNAWIIYDLGEVAILDEWYFWNIVSAGNMGIQTFNVYYSTTPTVAPTHGPTSSGAVLEYSFASGGWTLLNDTGVLMMPIGVAGSTPPDLIVDMEGATARYIAVEVISNWGSSIRVGLGEQGASKFTYTKAVSP